MMKLKTILRVPASLFFALLLVTLCGCAPSKKPTGNDTAASADETDETRSGTATGAEPEASSVAAGSTTGSATPSNTRASFTVTGDLDAADWDSMVGKEVTISGDLVIVDTYDLARRG
ncbi:MAG: hypothetical protein AAF483_15900, partial [Planctomycetota bacterium]